MRAVMWSVLLVGSLLGGPCEAKRPQFQINHKINCGDFQAETSIVGFWGETSDHVETQTIRLMNRARHISRLLDLGQHRSPDHEAGGRMMLDGVATDWFCIKAATGKTYLDVGFDCNYDYARTCHGMRDEWTEYYDDTGHSLGLRHLSDAALTRLFYRLRMPETLPNGGYIYKKDTIFP